MKSRRERVASNRAAGTSGKDTQMTDLDINGVMLIPFLCCLLSLVYKPPLCKHLQRPLQVCSLSQD